METYFINAYLGSDLEPFDTCETSSLTSALRQADEWEAAGFHIEVQYQSTDTSFVRHESLRWLRNLEDRYGEE